MAPKRSSRGKQKVELKKIESKNDLFVAFTTRKSGIYNKASELTTLSGASVDILMLSPTGKPYCYGDPSSKSITKTSLNDENPSIEEEMMKLEIIQQNEKNDDLLDKKHAVEGQRKNLKMLKTSGYWSIQEEDDKSCQYDQVKEIDKSLVAVTNKLINNVLKNGGNLNPRVISTIEELNGVKTNPAYVFEDNNKDHEIGASKGMVANASHDIETQGVNLIGASRGYGSGVDHASSDI